MRLRWTVVATLLLVAQHLSGQSLLQNDGRSARSIGLGGAHLITSPDPTAAACNPALLSSLREAQLAFSPRHDFSFSSAGIAGFWPQAGGFGAAIMRQRVDRQYVDRLSLGWGKSFTPVVSVGLAVHGNQLNEDEFTTATLGFIVHPLGDRLPLYGGEIPSPVFNPVASPYPLAFGFQASDLPFGEERLAPYYKASIATRTSDNGPSLFATFEWRHRQTATRLGIAVPVMNHFTLYSGTTDFKGERTAIGGAYASERYAFDIVYSFAEKRFLGGLSMRLGPSAMQRAQRHMREGKRLAKSRDYRAALREMRNYLVYNSENENARRLEQALTSKVAAEDQRIKDLLEEAKTLEDKYWYISATLNYLKVLKIDRHNDYARRRLEILQPRVDIYINQIYARGVQAFEEGNYEVASRAFENILLVRKRHKDAEHYLAQIAEIRKQQADDLYWRGLGYYSQRNLPKAIESFQEALALAPNHAEAQSYLQKSRVELEQQKAKNLRLIAEAQRLERRQQFMNAYKIYRKVLDADPANETARQHIITLQSKIDDFIASKMRSGKRALQRGDLARADEAFKAVLAVAPHHRDARNHRDRIAEIRRSRIEDHFRHAMALFDARQWRQSVEAFERVLQLDPGHKLAARKRSEAMSQIGLSDLFAQGERYYNDGQYYKAMEVFDYVLAQDPNNEQARKYLDSSQRQLNLKVEQHFNRGLNYYANEDYDNAIQEWESALALNPDHAQSLEYLEQARLRLKALEQLTSP